MKDKDLKQFIEKYGDDVCNAILKLADGEECSNELERLVAIEMEDGEVGRVIDEYGQEFFDGLYEFMKRKASMEAKRPPYKKGVLPLSPCSGCHYRLYAHIGKAMHKYVIFSLRFV